MLARQQNFKKKSCCFLLIQDSMYACLHALIWTIEYNVSCKKKKKYCKPTNIHSWKLTHDCCLVSGQAASRIQGSRIKWNQHLNRFLCHNFCGCCGHTASRCSWPLRHICCCVYIENIGGGGGGSNRLLSYICNCSYWLEMWPLVLNSVNESLDIISCTRFLTLQHVHNTEDHNYFHSGSLKDIFQTLCASILWRY